MNIKDYLLDELKRLNRMNDLLEKRVNQSKAYNDEPEQIAKNVTAICQIAETICKKQFIY